MRIIDLNLDFNTPALQRTNITLNQANKDSVAFNIRVYDNAVEIKYLNYDRAELIFQKPDKSNVTADADMSGTGLFYVLGAQIFAVTGLIKGYVNLYQGGTVAATLYYNFMVLPDLLNFEAISGSYVSAIEKVLVEMQKIYIEIENVLAEAGNIADAAMDEVRDQINDALVDVNQAINDALLLVDEARQILEGLESEAFASVEYVNTAIENMAVKDGTLQENLNSQLLDGHGSGDFALKDGNLQKNLNAALLEGHASVYFASYTDLKSHLNAAGIHVSSDIIMHINPTLSSGDITQIIDMPSGTCKITSAVTGMGQAGLNWIGLWIKSDAPGNGLLIASQAGGMGNVQYSLALNNAFPTWDKFDTALVSIAWSRLTGVPANVANAFSAAAGGNVNAKTTVICNTLNIANTGDAGGLQVQSANGQAAAISLHRPGAYAINFGLDTDNVLKVGGWSMGGVAYAITHAGNLANMLAALPGI